MRMFPGIVRFRILARSFAVQASFNYKTLIGTGFAFVIAPGVRHLHGSVGARDDETIARHAEVFNAHPYLVPLAAGAVLRMEHDGVDPATISRFKQAIRSSLGSLGDRLFWAGWRPATALLGLAVLLLGGSWWAAILAFLVPYNALHLWVRGWGLKTGLTRGLEVAGALRNSPLSRWADWASSAGALLAGTCAVLAAARTSPSATGPAVGGLAVLIGGILGLRVRKAAVLILVFVWAITAATLLLSPG